MVCSKQEHTIGNQEGSWRVAIAELLPISYDDDDDDNHDDDDHHHHHHHHRDHYDDLMMMIMVMTMVLETAEGQAKENGPKWIGNQDTRAQHQRLRQGSAIDAAAGDIWRRNAESPSQGGGRGGVPSNRQTRSPVLAWSATSEILWTYLKEWCTRERDKQS